MTTVACLASSHFTSFPLLASLYRTPTRVCVRRMTARVCVRRMPARVCVRRAEARNLSLLKALTL